MSFIEALAGPIPNIAVPKKILVAVAPGRNEHEITLKGSKLKGRKTVDWRN
jgi:hypothetical protein